MTIDLMTPFGAVFALLPEIILTITACIVLLVAGWRRPQADASRLAGWISMAGIIASAVALANMWWNGYSNAGMQHMIALDTFRYASSGILLLTVVLAVGLSIGYMEREDLVAPEYYGLVLLAAVGMMLLAGAVDFIVLFLGLEVMSVAAYVLAAFNRRSQASAEAGLKYFLIGAFASAFLLYGIALLYGATGTTNIILTGLQLTVGPISVLSALGVGMLLIGFAFKVSAVPFHMWAPDVYDGAPTPVTGLMATGVKAAAFLALMRVLMQGLEQAQHLWQPIVATMAVLTMVVGNLVALSQRSVKRMLAYSSIAHAGYLLVAVWPGTRLGAAAMLTYLTAYGLTTMAAFGLLAMIGRDGERDVTNDQLAGLATKRPWVAFALAVCMLSLLGFPGTFGFIAKWMVLSAVIIDGQWGLAVVVALASVVSAGYYLPVIMAMYMREPEEGVTFPPVTVWGAGAGVVAMAIVGILVLGLWPADLIALFLQSAAELFREALPVAVQ